jgi:hypothetical protein
VSSAKAALASGDSAATKAMLGAVLIVFKVIWLRLAGGGSIARAGSLAKAALVKIGDALQCSP